MANQIITYFINNYQLITLAAIGMAFSFATGCSYGRIIETRENRVRINQLLKSKTADMQK